jgi:hypothetical protein
MAINVVFNGATIFKPGSYSKTDIDLGGGFPIGPAGLIAVIGEADAGKPGSLEVDIKNNRFVGDQINNIRAKYRSGPIVDAAPFLFAPGADANIPSGANTVWFYKTNASTQAELALANAYGDITSLEWGVGGNRITAKVVAVDEAAAVQTGSAFDESGLVGGEEFSVSVNGETANVFTGIVVADNAALAAALADGANWSAGLPTEFTVTVGGVDTASTIEIELNADATANQNGYARNMEIAGADVASYGLTAGLVRASVEPSVTLSVSQKRDDITEEEILGGNVILKLGRDGTGAATEAWVEITDDAINLYDAAVGPTPTHSFLKDSYPILSSLVAEINLKTGWTASVANPVFNQLPLSALDQVTVAAFSEAGLKPALVKNDAYSVARFFVNSGLVSMAEQVGAGLPDALTETSLAGGAKGATSTADIVAALDKFTKFHVNFIVPLYSRDASDDILDGLTDAGSTYTIDGIHQAVKTHVSLMKSTKKRSERQAYLSYKADYVACKEKAGDLGDGRFQLLIQDIRQLDSLGNIRWFQPWALAAIYAGARAGSPIGNPLTFKFLNVSGIRHTAQPMSTADEDIVIDFDPDLQTDDAIRSGITFLEEPQTGGFRVVVDNTTYGRDQNFVFNRGNAIYAAATVAFNFRNQMEALFVGRKNTVAVADIVGAATSALTLFNAQGITTSTPGAPNGFKDLVVRLEGNTIFIAVTIVIVEGIDFVLSEFSITRATV